MLQKLEDFLFNQLMGKIIARGAVTLAAYLAAQQLPVHLDPSELTALVIAGAHAVFEWIKHLRNKPVTPAPAPEAPAA